FQAEDGIRDLTVTGVQTCALPISKPSCQSRSSAATPRVGTDCNRGATAATSGEENGLKNSALGIKKAVGVVRRPSCFLERGSHQVSEDQAGGELEVAWAAAGEEVVDDAY